MGLTAMIMPKIQASVANCKTQDFVFWVCVNHYASYNFLSCDLLSALNTLVVPLNNTIKLNQQHLSRFIFNFT
jgi:hypothetical protein